LLADGGVVVALFKPQYETRDRRILRHGVIRDAQARENLAADFARWSAHNGWEIHNKTESPIRGDKGNGEYLFLMTSAPDDPNAGQ
jgi:23S rRNA (cytidine1920-2'-O)/16S rRNA (cytidine1409-2'-O)-methyltransferase